MQWAPYGHESPRANRVTGPGADVAEVVSTADAVLAAGPGSAEQPVRLANIARAAT